MTHDLVIRGGTVVTAYDVFDADVAVNGETIVAVGPDLTGRRVLDARGKLVIPGGIDVHVHLGMPIGRFTSTDDFYAGTRAAAFGGTTAVVDFVETKPGESMLEALAARRALADPQAAIDYGLHMTIGPGDISKLDQVRAARDAGCASFKLYMAYGLRLDDGQLLQALDAVARANALAVVHAENWDVITTLIGRNLAAGRTGPHWHPRSRPASLEAEAVGRVIDIAQLVGARVHIFHVSCAAAAERIADAKAGGLAVFGETCPQYLYLTDEVFDQPGVAGALSVCSPPLRPAADGEALWQSLVDGSLDLVSTDHCPFTAAEKATGLELNDYSQIPGGVPSIEGRLALVYHGLVGRALALEGTLAAGDSRSRLVETALRRWVEVCSATPAQLHGFDHKGHIAPGFDADIVLFDPTQEWVISPASLHETAGWTPYDGLALQGKVTKTVSRGEIIVNDGEWLAAPGRGRFVVR